MLASIQDVVQPLEAEGGERRVWVDMFCASQNLLAGVYCSPSISKESDPAGYYARKEDTNRIFDDALEAIDEVYFYCSPLVGLWNAPPHPFLSPQREAKGAPAQPWVRRGAAAITRAWCLFELSTALSAGCKLYVALSRVDRARFQEMLTKEFDQIAGIVAAVDARDTQITKVDDRGYILGRIEGLAPNAANAEMEGLSRVTECVTGALRGWLASSAQEELAKLTPAERATSTLINSVGRLLQAQGDLEGAELILREAVDGCREVLGDRHPQTLASVNDLGWVLEDKGKLDSAEVLYREAIRGRRETLGDRHRDTLISIGRLGWLVMMNKGDQDEAEAFLREAMDGRRETLGERHPDTLEAINDVGCLLRRRGDVDGAEVMLRESLERSKDVLGARHKRTLESMHNLGAVLREKGDLDGAEELLHKALEVSRELNGYRHIDTLFSMRSLGSLVQAQGNLNRAEALLRDAVETSRDMLGNRHPISLRTTSDYADLLRETGDLNEARRAMGEAPETAREALGLKHIYTLEIEANAARIGVALGEAEALIELREIVVQMEAAEHPRTCEFTRLLHDYSS